MLSGLVVAHWTKEVLRERASYLMTCPELMLRLSNIYETINTRTSTGNKLSRLHGKLDLMLAQVKNHGISHRSQITYNVMTTPLQNVTM